jgi:hypothetical protein
MARPRPHRATRQPRRPAGVTIHLTERGTNHYGLVRQEWAAAVSAAAANDTSNLDAALTLLAAVKAGLVRMRPPTAASRLPT